MSVEADRHYPPDIITSQRKSPASEIGCRVLFLQIQPRKEWGKE